MRELQEACEPARDPHYNINPEWRNSAHRPPPPQELEAITQRAIDTFLMSRGEKIGLGGINGIGWWQAANAYTAIALHDVWSGEHRNYRTLDEILRACESKHAGFINEFNDDTLWWAMCCVHMYQIGGDRWYLEKARGVWRHIRSGSSICGRGAMKFMDMDMEGGCFWTTRPGEGQINSISSGLYAELSVRLAMLESGHGNVGGAQGQGHDQQPLGGDRGGGGGGGGGGGFEQKHPHMGGLFNQLKEAASGGGGGGGHSGGGGGGGHGPVSREEYLEAARCSLGWILRCRYRAKEGVVMDGFRTKKGEDCNWTFTYTTAVAIGVCALMYEASPNEDEYLFLACHMANKSLRRKQWVEDNGVLTEHGAYGRGTHDPAKNNDSVGFKSVLMRQLCVLYNVIRTMKAGQKHPRAKETADLIRTFVNVNFESQMTRNTNGNSQYGPWWNGPMDVPSSHSQMAVLDVMAAMELVLRK